MKITVAGAGYVGFSLAVLLSSKYSVTAFDIDRAKAEKINSRKPIFKDSDIENFLKEKKLDLFATCDEKAAYENADYIIIALPTDYDERTKKFDTRLIKNAVQKIKVINPSALIIIKSTVPVGYTEQLKKECRHNNIVFSPEFLREGKALYDNLYPARIIIGRHEKAADFAAILKNQCNKKDVPVLYMGNTEAEAVKLFANNYLAARIAFFNELDTYAEINGLDTKSIIDGVCLDTRIGNYYNNPSFGYGGYCLPKDTQQMSRDFNKIPGSLIKSTAKANPARKNFIANQIIKKAGNKTDGMTIGICRLVMKSDSDNFRSSAVLDIIKILQEKGFKIIIYEPILKVSTFEGCRTVNDLEQFKKQSDLIVANRITADLKDVLNKCYSRDIFEKD